MASNFNPLSLIASPITGAFQYAGAKKQADAAEQAAQLQATAAQNALDYTKQKQGEQLAAFAPYQAVSQAALAGGPPKAGASPTPYNVAPGTLPSASPQPTNGGMPMSAMGGSPSVPQTAFTTPPAAPAGNPPAPVGPGGQGGAMVLLQAPDGSTKSVPAAQAQAWIAKGAKRVG